MRRFVFILTILLLAILSLAVIFFVVVLDGLDFLGPKEKPPQEMLHYQKAALMLVMDIFHSNSETVDNAKGMGANTIVLGFDLKTEGSALIMPNWDFQWLRAAKLTKRAYKNEMHVEVRTLQNPDSSNPANAREFLESAIPVMVKLAKFSEEQKAARFTIMGETENQWGLADHPEFIDIYIQTLLKEVRKHYNGEVGIGFCCPITDEHNISGFDYVMISVNPGSNRDLEEYTNTTVADIKKTKKWMSAYGVDDLIIGEVGFLSEEDAERFPWATSFTMILDGNEEAAVYDDLIERTNKDLSGYTFYYGFPILSIKEREAEAVVKKWFEKLP